MGYMQAEDCTKLRSCALFICINIFILAAIGAHQQQSPTTSNHDSAADLDNLSEDKTEEEDEDQTTTTDQSEADIESDADSDVESNGNIESNGDSDIEDQNPSSQKG